ncbi:hypothetical protein DV736_g5432, partial [Chaetothyriales sp. CBS 134916]
MADEHSHNTFFLYVCANESDAKFDWLRIGDVLGLKPPTAAMRWQRLKARLDKEGIPSQISASAKIDESTVYLYQCILNSSLKIDFTAVGKATGLRPSTAAMRFRRLLNKIKKHEGKEASEDGASTAAAATAATATAAPAKAAKIPGGSSRGRKRKVETPKPKPDCKEGFEAGDEVVAPAKKIRTEDKQNQADNEQK